MARDRDPYRVPPDRRPTEPRQPHVVVGEPNDEPTKVQCPCCAGSGYVSPEVAVTFEALCAELREQA